VISTIMPRRETPERDEAEAAFYRLSRLILAPAFIASQHKVRRTDVCGIHTRERDGCACQRATGEGDQRVGA
jgi:hypothetical protein